MVDYFLIFMGIICLIFLIIFKYLFHQKRYKINNESQAQTHYEHMKTMFIRWNQFLMLLVLGLFSVTITYLIKYEFKDKFSNRLIVTGSIFLVIFILTISLTGKSMCRMNSALRTLLKFQKTG